MDGPELTWWWREDAGGEVGAVTSGKLWGKKNTNVFFPCCFTHYNQCLQGRMRYKKSSISWSISACVYMLYTCIYTSIFNVMQVLPFSVQYLVFALPEVVYTSLPMPLFTLLSVNMWLSSVSCSWGQGHTAGDEHRKKNCKARQLPVRTLGHWAIYNLSVSPSFAFVFLCSVFIRQSWYQPRSFHAKGNCAVKSELHCLAAPFDFLRCGEAFVKSTMLGHLKKKQNTILRCMNSSVHD